MFSFYMYMYLCVFSPAEEMDCEASNDDDFSSVSDSDGPEDETTIAEQEAFEETVDHSQEISMLEEEGLSVVLMPIMYM